MMQNLKRASTWKTGASHIAELTNRIETLTTENLLSISDRKTLLLKIVDNTLLEATDNTCCMSKLEIQEL
jgi:hypothetical protein